MRSLTHEQKKGNILREFDGFAKLAAIDPDFCEDVTAGAFGRRNGGDFNQAHAQAKTAIQTIQMMANGEFNFSSGAKAAQTYFAPEHNSEECIVNDCIDDDD